MSEVFTFADSPRTVVLRPVDPAGDAEVVHAWMHQPHVEPFWEMAWPLERIEGYLVENRTTGHLHGWIAEVDDLALAYVETYVVADDALAEVFPAAPGDLGWHVLVGPPDALGTGRPRLVGRAVLRHLLGRPGTERVLCEPDARNQRMINFCRRLGHRQLAAVEVAGKQAVVLGCDRASFTERFPHDLVAAGAR